ncbi:hypothetical protein VFPFJ_09099 [Purpureocillium lilacinum]|uniref:Uncharacterized protein n=1 Tax=Purpureocillium lilacinum TaxID=33203 RepID=A0A179GZ78_PURLI|nr:hypothetical protein VFPFJ_09099 [Purpureocillium lilacinum]OAQ83296.1 hypothetical protein VFPFJ_09099 [Purpureocillium lilacinum]
MRRAGLERPPLKHGPRQILLFTGPFLGGNTRRRRSRARICQTTFRGDWSPSVPRRRRRVPPLAPLRPFCISSVTRNRNSRNLGGDRVTAVRGVVTPSSSAPPTSAWHGDRCRFWRHEPLSARRRRHSICFWDEMPCQIINNSSFLLKVLTTGGLGAEMSSTNTTTRDCRLREVRRTSAPRVRGDVRAAGGQIDCSMAQAFAPWCCWTPGGLAMEAEGFVSLLLPPLPMFPIRGGPTTARAAGGADSPWVLAAMKQEGLLSVSQIT